MFAFADVEAIVGPFNYASRSVEDTSFGSNTIRNSDPASCTLSAFGRDQTTIDDVCVGNGTFCAVVDADTIAGTPSIRRFLAAALNSCAKSVEDRVGHDIIGFVANLQRDTGTAVANACVNRTAREVANADIFGCCVGIDGPVTLITCTDDITKVANADAFAFDLNGPAV